MPTVIIYMSKHGTTEKVAGMLKEELSDKPIDLFDLNQVKEPDLTTYDQVIIGGSIHMGKIQSGIRKYCDAKEQVLLTKRLGLFICYMDTNREQQEFESSYSETLRKHATAHGLFGGEFLIEKMNMLERMMVKRVAGVKESVHNIQEDAIQAFAEKMNEVPASSG